MIEPVKITENSLLDIGYESRRGMIRVTEDIEIGLSKVDSGWQVRIYSDDRQSSFTWPNKFTLLGQVKSLISLLRD